MLKGLVHPKMKISLCFTHPEAILGVYAFFLLDKFRYKPRGDWFSFAKVRKLCFLKQTRETSISQRHTRDAYVLRHPPERFCIRQSAEVIEKCLLRLKYGYFSYKNTWIRCKRPLFTPRSCVRHVLLWMRTLYLTCFGLLKRNTCPLQR